MSEVTKQTDKADVAGSRDVENYCDSAFYGQRLHVFSSGIKVINGTHTSARRDGVPKDGLTCLVRLLLL